MTDDAWRTKQKNMNQREFCFVLFSGNFYRSRSIVERRVLFINSFERLLKDLQSQTCCVDLAKLR